MNCKTIHITFISSEHPMCSTTFNYHSRHLDSKLSCLDCLECGICNGRRRTEGLASSMIIPNVNVFVQSHNGIDYVMWSSLLGIALFSICSILSPLKWKITMENIPMPMPALLELYLVNFNSRLGPSLASKLASHSNSLLLRRSELSWPLALWH